MTAPGPEHFAPLRRRWWQQIDPWSLAMGAVVGVGLVAIGWAAAKAATPALDEPGERTHQLLICRPGEDCEKRGTPSGKIACDVNAASDRLAKPLPTATVIKCERVRR